MGNIKIWDNNFEKLLSNRELSQYIKKIWLLYRIHKIFQVKILN